MRTRVLVFVLAPVLLAAAGCGPAKINENRTFTLDTNTSGHRLDIPADKKPRTLTVEFASSEKEVSVLLFKRSDVKDGEDGIMEAQNTQKLAGTRATADRFTAEIPADTPTTIIIRGHAAPKTNVTLKVTTAP